MNIAALDADRIQLLARKEAQAHLEHSPDPDERVQYLQAAQAYQKAEDAYQRAASLLTTDELDAVSKGHTA